MPKLENKPLTYKDAGVDIDEGARLVELIKPYAKATARPGSDAGLGGFAAAFDLKAAGYKDPLILSTTDGVGTKLKVAIEAKRTERIGIDLVAMCVNDLIANGAEPLVFLDYFATAKLNADDGAIVIKGIAEGCLQAGCVLAGGETAEMPGLYALGDFDLAGFSLGAAERGALLPRFDAIKSGDVLVGIASSGPHSNGYSLIRAIVARHAMKWDAPAPWTKGASLGDALLEPTRIYVKQLLPLIRAGDIKGLAHITGGGLTENTPRALPPGVAPRFDWKAWERPDVFKWLQDAGNVPEDDIRRTLNLGIGMIAVVAKDRADAVIAGLKASGETATVIGEVVSA
jgi:phosphoribosylaminoimidazole synthetase